MALSVTTAHYLDDYESTSTTSFTMGTSGSQTITVGTGKAFYVGMTLELARQADNAVYQRGTITAYDAGTGSLTFTKTTGGSGTGTYSDWNVSYIRGDTVTMTANLTIRSTPMQALAAINSTDGVLTATLSIENSSTTTPIVFSFYAALNTNRFYTTNGSTLKFSGEYIDIYTGTGSSGQTIDFNTAVGGVPIDYPPFVLVETGSGTGVFKPFLNLAGPSDAGGVNINTEASNTWELGSFFNYNRTTKVATFGDGTHGIVIPNGARVRYPNIHITAPYTSTVSSRPKLMVFPAGSIDWDTVAISNAINIGDFDLAYTGISATMREVGYAHRMYLNYLNKDCYLDGIYGCLDADNLVSTNLALRVSVVLGDTTAKNIYVVQKVPTVANQSTVGFDSISAFVDVSNIRGFVVGTMGSVVTYGVNISGFPKTYPLTITDIYSCGVASFGGEGYLVKNLYTSQTCKSAIETSALTLAIVISGSYIAVETVRMIPGGSMVRYGLVNFGYFTHDVAIHDAYFDASNLSYLFHANGSRIWLTNFHLTKPPRNQYINGSNPSRYPYRISNVWCDTTVSSVVDFASCGGSHNDYVSKGSAANSTGGSADISPFYAFSTNIARTVGIFGIGPWAKDVTGGMLEIVSGTEGVDYEIKALGRLALPGNGVEIIYTSARPFPVRGITSFTGGTLSNNGTNQNSGVTYEFKMKGYRDKHFPSSWSVLSVANLQASLSAISGYDSDEGFYFKFRITTQTAVPDRSLRETSISGITFAGSYTPPEVGFISVGVSGVLAGTSVGLYDNSGTPVWIDMVETTSSLALFDMPWGFSTTPAKYLIRSRKYDKEPIESSGECYIKGAIVPLTQEAANVVASEATAAAMTGIEIDYALGKVTVTEDHSFQDIFDYCRWSLAQLDNLDYDNFIDGTAGNWTLAYDLEIDNCQVSGTGTVYMLSNVLTLTGTGDTSVSIRASNGTRTSISVTNIVDGSRVQIYNVTDDTELYNDVPGTSLTLPVTWTSDKSIRIRAKYTGSSSAYLMYTATGTLAQSGLAVSVGQVIDTVYATNSINGSSVTECSISGAVVRIYVDDADNTTTFQRIYNWYQYILSTAVGIADQSADYFFAISSVEYRFDPSMKVINQDITNPLNIVGANVAPTSGTASIIDTSNGASIAMYSYFPTDASGLIKGMLTVPKFLALK